MIVWRGKGWLIPVIVIASFILASIGLDAIYGEGFYKENVWPKYAAIILSAVLVGILGYFINYKNRIVIVDPESGVKKKSPAHTLFFIPVEIWAVIIPIFFIWMEANIAETNERELALIKSPEVNDIYSVDFTDIFTEADTKYKYGSLKVVAVQSDGVQVIASEIAYNKKSGVRKDIRKGKVYDEGYYLEDPFYISSQSIIDLKSDNTIFQVSRQ